MRTTLNIDDEALATVKRHAEERNISMGQAASDLIHRGSVREPVFEMRNGFAVFPSPPGTPVVTNETIDAWEEAYYVEEAQRALSPGR